MKKNRNIVLITIIIIIIFIVTIGIIFKKNSKRYDINALISNYDLTNYKIENEYINYLKEYIYPKKLREYIDNDYITFSQYKETATGNTIKNQMEFKAYKLLFNSMFNKSRTNFDDCPVTDNFKEKYKTNLLKYFNLIESDDCESNCLLNRKDKEITVEIYGNFENTEPTYWKTHHFHYTLDDEGNVDDVIFDYTE